MAADTKRFDALQLIFSIFLGALLVVVIGVGVWTFYPQPYGPSSPEEMKLQELYRQQEQINMKGSGSPSAVDLARSKRIQEQIDDLNKTMQVERDKWAVNTSIILLVFATALMAISLFLPDHMRVFSNGILLGGLFTIVYGTGWSFAGGDSRARFFVVLVALILAVVFGYLRFIRGRREPAAVAPMPAPAVAAGAAPALAGEALSALEARVSALEARAAAAAKALGAGETPHDER